MVGGTRFIGPRVVRRLVRHGHEVAVFHRGQHEAELPPQVRRFKDPRAAIPVVSIPAELRAYDPDVVCHMIAMGEEDAVAAREAFVDVARRVVLISSGDVYRAYGLFKGTEDGELEPTPLRETAALRSRLYPYRLGAPAASLEHFYDKVLAEKALAADRRLPVTILRLPNVYGPEDNANLWSVYNFRARPHWRWTHGYVENVAHAIALAIESEAATGRTYNVGEQTTPTMGERLERLPARRDDPPPEPPGNFAQDIWYDTSAIRTELGYRELVPEREAMLAVCRNALGPPR